MIYKNYVLKQENELEYRIYKNDKQIAHFYTVDKLTEQEFKNMVEMLWQQ